MCFMHLQVVNSLTAVEANLLSARLAALEACLEPGLSRLNWSSRGIDSFVATTTKAIHDFQALHHSVKKNSAILEKLVNGLAAAQLVPDLPAGEHAHAAQLDRCHDAVSAYALCCVPCFVQQHSSRAHLLRKRQTVWQCCQLPCTQPKSVACTCGLTHWVCLAPQGVK